MDRFLESFANLGPSGVRQPKSSPTRASHFTLSNMGMFGLPTRYYSDTVDG